MRRDPRGRPRALQGWDREMKGARYLRLIVPELDRGSRRERGLFGPAYDLLDEERLPTHEHQRLEEIVSWFESHLPVPDRSSLRPRAIFWFRLRAEPMIKRFWNLAGVLSELDYEVRILKTARPGYVLYEDDYQVGAIPFRDTF